MEYGRASTYGIISNTQTAWELEKTACSIKFFNLNVEFFSSSFVNINNIVCRVRKTDIKNIFDFYSDTPVLF